MEPLKKKKKISGYYIWVTKGRINQKERKKENIGSEIPVLGRDLSAPWPLKYRCSAIQNLYEQHISTRTCISKVAIYYWRDISLNIREEFTRTIRIIGSLSSLRNFELEQDQIVLPFTRISISKNIIPLKLRTPHLLSTYIIYPKLGGDARRRKAKRRGARKIGLVISQKFMDWRVQGRGRGTQLGEFPRQKAIDRGG